MASRSGEHELALPQLNIRSVARHFAPAGFQGFLLSAPTATLPMALMIPLVVLLCGFVAEAGTGCYDVETHQCDCTVTEAQCHARQGTWTDGCRSCDAVTNEQHPQCQKQYSWGCFDTPSHACECTISERACDQLPNKTWTHECPGFQGVAVEVIGLLRFLIVVGAR